MNEEKLREELSLGSLLRKATIIILFTFVVAVIILLIANPDAFRMLTQ